MGNFSLQMVLFYKMFMPVDVLQERRDINSICNSHGNYVRSSLPRVDTLPKHVSLSDNMEGREIWKAKPLFRERCLMLPCSPVLPSEYQPTLIPARYFPHLASKTEWLINKT